MLYKMLALSTFTLLAACGGGSSTPTPANPAPIAFDCLDGTNCPEILIQGDPEYTLPGGIQSPLRGLADPSIRKDPNSNRLWMSYSYVGLKIDPSADPANPFVTQYVSVHLAHSDDNGASWQYDKSIWESTLGTDQGMTSDVGYSVHEVSTITPFVFNSATEWFALHLRYFLKLGDPIENRLSDSFHHRLTRASTPIDLGSNTEANLTYPLTAPGWGSDVNFSQLNSSLNDCDLWSEPGLFQEGNQLYLIIECIKIDTTVIPAVRLYAEEFNAVFVADVSADVTAFNWQWVGNITDSSTAAEFGVNILTQVDIARARDGSLLLIVTPTNEETGVILEHQGCRIIEIESLNPPQLARYADGSLIVRAEITSSDSDSSGLCGYDPASDTGVILVRTIVDPVTPELFWQMHATGIHP